MKAAYLPDRGVVKVAGDGAPNFLQGLLTNNVLKIPPETARFAALLTPQGKIIADFFIVEAPAADGGGFFLDVARTLVAPLIAKLNLYKLRAKVIVEDLSEVLGVLAVWDGDAESATAKAGLRYADPRLAALGLRIMLPPHRAEAVATGLGAMLVGLGGYDAHRIALGVPQGGADFGYGDAFPHEADMDQFGGIDFAKGCYVGQEVVSRMEHRGSARTRAVPVTYDAAAPQAGSAVTAGGQSAGTMGSSAGGKGLALVRLDRAAEALSRGEALTAGGVPIRLVKPDWARFAFPGETGSSDTNRAAE
jgi:folate-binding protein YgfZ